MADITFNQQLALTLIDKAVIGGLLALVAYAFNRLLAAFQATQAKEIAAFQATQAKENLAFQATQAKENAAFQASQAKELESFKHTQSEKLESFKLDQNRSLESFKHTLVTESEISRNLRNSVAEVAKRVAAGTHTMCWLCWIARYSPEELQIEHLQTYDKEIHLILSDVVGARVVLAALNESAHAELSPLIDKLYNLDVDVGEAKSRYLKDKEGGLKALAKLHQQALDFDDDLLEAVAKLSAFKTEYETKPAA